MNDTAAYDDDEEVKEKIEDIKYIRDLAQEIKSFASTIDSLVCVYYIEGKIYDCSVGSIPELIGLLEYSKTSLLNRLTD